MPRGSPWYDLVRNGGGSYTSPGYFDGIVRMVAVRPLIDYPLVVNASASEEAVLAAWRRQAIVRGGGAALIFAYAAFLMRLSSRQFVRLRQSREAVVRKNAKLVRVSNELEQNRQDLSACDE